MGAPFVWSGRTDGEGPLHRRFWNAVVEPGTSADAAIIGFASDEGVRRNKGRVGAAAGPTALRSALASLAVHEDLVVADHGDVVVQGDDLEGGQQRLGEAIAAAGAEGTLTVVLGGGHETAYGSHLGLGPRPGLGVLNLDAHFDLREAVVPTSGTPFLQIARDRQDAGVGMDYAVVGISRTSNTGVLFDVAASIEASWLLDDDCQEVARVREFVDGFLADLDEVYLTIDLDVLPAAVAPGVSAPAALGVPPFVIQTVCDAVVDSGKLVHLDVTELNPGLDVDQRTAKVAARLVHRVITRESARRRSS